MTLDGESELDRHTLPDGQVLVWRDEGSPYHNVLHVYALDAYGAVIDAVEAGAPMADGILQIRQVSGRVIDFGFFANDKTYRLIVGQAPALRAPLSLPPGFRYKSTFRRHILHVTTI
jgi:hypothetical protein